jgi:hypothetical protein
MKGISNVSFENWTPGPLCLDVQPGRPQRHRGAWRNGGEMVTGETAWGLIPFLEASVGAEIDAAMVLHALRAPGVEVLFLCTALQAEGAKLKANGSVGEGFKITFSGCSTDVNGSPNSLCVPTDKVAGKGKIVTNSLHGLIVLHKLANGVKDDLFSIAPDTGETLALIEMPVECILGTKAPVFGKVVLEDGEGLALTHLIKHLVKAGPLTELWAFSTAPSQTATLLGSAWTLLLGAHAGLQFSGDPA